MDSGLKVLMEHEVREVTPVVNDDIVFLQELQVLHSARALTGSGNEIKVEWQLSPDLVEAAQ
jgi:hypothetical protein